MAGDSDTKWFIGILLTGFVAWWFRNREAKKATHLKDLRSKIDAVTTELNAIEDLIPDYFLMVDKAENLPISGLKIKAKLRRVGTIVNAIFHITGYSDWIVKARSHLQELIPSVLPNAKQYIAHGEKALTTLEKIRGSITNDKADIVEKRRQMSQDLLTCLKNFRQAVTLKNFDDKDRTPLKSDDQQFEKIFAASSRLKDALEAIYESEKKL